jgi:hypothetical protein
MVPATITEAALRYLGQLLSDIGAGEEMSVRIDQAANGLCTFNVGRHDDGDKQFKYRGRTVLVLDKETSEHLAGRIVDVEMTDGGEQIILKDT